jgi:hypothetical protein
MLVFGEGGEIAALVGELGAGVVIPARTRRRWNAHSTAS